MRAPPVARALVVAGLALALLVGLTPAGVAASTNIADSPRLLPHGAALGSGEGSATTAATSQPGAGPCGPPRRSGSKSASVFGVPSHGKRLLTLSLADDAAGSLCYVGVYRATGNGLTFTNPQDIDQRATLQRGSTSGCASVSSCALEVWLDAGAAYYVVAWARPGEHASFEYAASVRLQPAAAAFVTGHRVTDRGRHEVIAGRPFTVSARVPVPAGAVRFQYEIWTGSGWRQGFDDERTLSGGAASIGLKADPSGRRRFRVAYAGDETTLAWTSAYVEIVFVSPRWTRYSDGGVRLPVPWVHQQHRLSCEAASVRMALLSYGISQSDMQILGRIGIDSRPRSGNRWGDPERAFVGNVNGTMPETGYGVHAPPVEKTVNSYRPYRPAIRFKQASFATIAGHLDNGFPVVVWGAHPGRSGLHSISWTSWEGRRVSAMLVEHTWTLIGFRGPASNPTHFIVHDPSGAGGLTMTVADVRNFTRHFGNTGVVVR